MSALSAKYFRRQLALRRLLLDGRGELNADAKIIVADLRRFLRAEGALVQKDATGAVDPLATTLAAARREVWDRYARLLGVDMQQLMTARDEE